MDANRSTGDSLRINDRASESADQQKLPATDRCQLPVSGARAPQTSVSTRSVQTDDRMCSELPTTADTVLNSARPLSHSPAKPLRERRLPASFWQEPNVPRVRHQVSSSYSCHNLSSPNALKGSWPSGICHRHSVELCYCGGCAPTSDDAVGDSHSQSLFPFLQYFSTNSVPTYCKGVQQPTIDLATLYLGGLYQDSLLHRLQVADNSHPVAVVKKNEMKESGAARNQTMPCRCLNPPPLYDQNYRLTWTENRLLSTSEIHRTRVTDKNPLMSSEGAFIGNSVQGADRASLPSSSTNISSSVTISSGGSETYNQACKNLSQQLHGSKFDIRTSQPVRMDPVSSSSTTVSLAADYLRQNQGGIGSWVPRRSIEVDQSDSSLKPSEIHGCRRSETRATTVHIGEPLRTLLSNTEYVNGMTRADVANCGLFPVWREQAEATTARSAMSSHLRTAHRYRPY